MAVSSAIGGNVAIFSFRRFSSFFGGGRGETWVPRHERISLRLKDKKKKKEITSFFLRKKVRLQHFFLTREAR